MRKSVLKHISTGKIIMLSFLSVILLGAVILMLPISSAAGVKTPFYDALFTSTSAVCVTGLIVRDTATYWSTFGQAVILLMIQIGGMGVITVITVLSTLAGKVLGLREREIMQNAISAPHIGGVVRLTRFIVKGMIIIEVSGALLLMPSMCLRFGLKGIWYAFFYSISAFCNAGFDLFGSVETYSSLTSVAGNIPINTVIMLLIVIGGIGFLTWEDVVKNGIHFKKYSVQSKVCITAALLLIFIPALYFFFFEFSGEPMKLRILKSMFQSVTLRTAGFNTADYSDMSEAGRAISIPLMLTGGSPGSTAGGMKTTTLLVIFACTFAVFRRKESAELFNRRIENDTVKNAAALFLSYLILFFVGGIAISRIEALPLLDCLFETASAVGTVGLTVGITPTLGLVSKIILILLMFFGRIGGLTLVFAFLSNNQITPSHSPKGQIAVG